MPDRADITRANVALLQQETDALLRTVDALEADTLGEPSLCDGWTRAHVVAHLARNADALLNLVRWAVDGTERAAYISNEERARAIEEGARRSAPELRRDVQKTAAQFGTEAEQLLGPAGDTIVRTRRGADVTGAQLIGMRLLEVVFHHVDLDAGYSFDDADSDWVDRTLRRGVRQWSARDDAPDLTITPTAGEPLRVGAGGQQVQGSASNLLGWLARGVPDGVTSQGPLPTPPPWA